MSTTYTQGEWAFDDNEIYSESTDHGAAICTMNTTSAHFTQEEVKANARLIAAAPAMLAELIHVSERIGTVRPDDAFCQALKQIVDQAIQKATQP